MARSYIYYKNPPRTPFEQWVRNQGGSKELGKKLGVDSASVQHWVRGVARPGLLSTAKIIKLSQGELTLDDLIFGTRPRRGLRRTK